MTGITGVPVFRPKGQRSESGVTKCSWRVRIIRRTAAYYVGTRPITYYPHCRKYRRLQNSVMSYLLRLLQQLH